jgi:hypothetical protein
MVDSLLPYALLAAQRFGPVFPCHPLTKKSIINWGTGATTEWATLAWWWNQWPQANIGLATKPSKLVVIDCDMPDTGYRFKGEWDQPGITCGEDVLMELCAKKGGDLDELWSTYVTRTGSGGTHFYFAAPDGVEINNSANRIGPKIDVRAAGGEFGGLVLAAGSVTRSGRYRVVHDAPVRPLPAWLAALAIAPPPPPPMPRGPRLFTARRGEVDLGALMTWLSRQEPGNQSHALYWAGVEMAKTGVPIETAIAEAWAAARSWYCSKGPWTERDIRQQIGSAYRRR